MASRYARSTRTPTRFAPPPPHFRGRSLYGLALDPRIKSLGGLTVAIPSGDFFAGLGQNLEAGEAAIAAARKAYRGGGLGTLACLHCEEFLRNGTRRAGLGSLGLSYQGAASGAAAGAQAGSFIPGVGTAVGAVVGAIAGALFSKKKDPNAAEKEALKGQLDEYVRVQGSVPGRAFTLTVLKQLIDGAGYRGMWPNIKKWSGDAIAGAIDGCKGCTPPTIRQFVKDQVAAGDIDPISLASKFTEHVNRTWGSKWFVQTAGATQRQLMIDLMDYFVAENKPDAPLFYAPGWTVAANAPAPTPTPAPTPVPTPTGASSSEPGAPYVATGKMQDGLPIYQGPDKSLYTWNPNTKQLVLIYSPTSTTAPKPLPVQPPRTDLAPAIVLPTPSQPQVDVSALVSSLMQSGANQQQAFLAAMQNLQAQGVQTTPQVQQAVADQVQASGSATAIPTWALIGIPLVLGAVILIGRPKTRH